GKSNPPIEAGSQSDPRAKNRPISIKIQVSMLVSICGMRFAG
ncbi:MAG: hypothetical protein ACI9R3_003997, partial [Verrucomicrobiales bacterium]